MRIAIVGPTHPYKGGIVQHTTELAHRLQAAGHEVDVFGWASQYPFFYPGQQFVAADKPERPIFHRSHRLLSWKRPDSWWRLARRLKNYDEVVFIWWVPTVQGPVYRLMLQTLGQHGPRTTLICHNALPHEPRPGDRQLTRAVMRRVHRIIVHTEAQATIAATLTKRPVLVTPLPLILLADPPAHPTKRHGLLFFGLVRPYKGLSILLQAMARVPEATLSVCGEFWDDAQLYESLIHDLQLDQRVIIRQGYLPAEELVQAISSAAAVVLPYTAATGTWNARMAHAYGTPVIATRAGTLGEEVQDGIDGLLCEPADVTSLAAALQRFYQPGVAGRLQRGINTAGQLQDWQAYVEAVTKQ